jgi:hypothetical protein
MSKQAQRWCEKKVARLARQAIGCKLRLQSCALIITSAC